MRKTIAAVAVALVLAGCSGSNGNSNGSAGDASKATGKDACGLLTDEQINQAAQLAPKSHAPVPNYPVASCRWELNGENNVIKLYSGEANMFPIDAKGEPLPGLGDKAVWEPVGAKVQATKGGVSFELWPVLVNHEDMQKHVGVMLANDVAAKLGWGGGAKVPDAGGSSAPSTTTANSSKTATADTPTSASKEPDNTDSADNETTTESSETN